MPKVATVTPEQGASHTQTQQWRQITDIYTYILHIYISTHTHTYIYIYKHTYAHSYIYIHTYIYTCTYINTYIYTTNIHIHNHQPRTHPTCCSSISIINPKHAIAGWVFTVKTNIEKAIKIPYKSNIQGNDIMEKSFTHFTIDVMSLVILICNETLHSSFPTKTNINKRDFSQT